MRIRSRCTAFTLVELLVVVSVIALLIALLFPSLSKAKAAANSIVCQSNLRQLTFAMLAYANDSKGLFPANAVFSSEATADWVYWQSDRNVQDSAIARYVGGGLAKLLICPADELSARFRVLTDRYPYSYSFNYSFSQDYFGQVCKLGTIRRSSEKILMVCEDEWSADDGNWDGRLVGMTNENVLSNRHARPRNTSWESVHTLAASLRPDKDQMGNVSFSDGHAEAVPRSLTWLDTSYDALK